MTAPGGGDPNRDRPGPWQAYQHPPVDPQEPVNYPDYPPAPPYPAQQPPSYGYLPPYNAPGGYGGPPPYAAPGGYGAPPPSYPYDPYRPAAAQTTNGLAIASLVTSIAGVVFGIPLAIFCFIGWLIPVTAAVLGAVALTQIKRTGQQGRGMAIAGIVIGASTAALVLLFMAMYAAAAMHFPVFVG